MTTTTTHLEDVALEIKDLLEKRRQELELTFIEEKHIYFMKDNDGKLKSNFPSVSKIIKKFHKPFDAEGMALRMSKGDPDAAKLLQEQWKLAGSLSTNMGSRVHFELETNLIGRYGDYKEVRQPIFEIDDEQKRKSDNMIMAGKSFLDVMHERGATLLDTEIVLGDPNLQYTGQPDKVWLMMNKDQSDFGFVITDWKSNQPKNFEVMHYTGKMFAPFNNIHDNALGHYYLQLPFYGRLLNKMLEGTKFADKKLLGSVVVLLKDDASYVEYRVPPEVQRGVYKLDLSNYIKRW
jgi:hypothetical protein